MEEDFTAHDGSDVLGGDGRPPGRQRRWKRLALVAPIAVAASLAGAGVANAASSTSTKSHVAGTMPAGGPGAPGAPGGDGPHGTVTAIGSGTVTAAQADGTSVTFTTTSATTYEKDGVSSTAAALAVGDDVSVRTVRPTSTTARPSTTATEIDIMSPSISGTVQSVSSDTIVVADGQGFWRTIDTSASTTYTDGGAAATASAVTVGETIRATGSVDANHTDLDASSVDVVLPVKVGTVSAVSGDTITLKESASKTVTVTTSASTLYRSGSATANASSVPTGSTIAVEGTVDSSGNIAATSLTVLPAPPAGKGPGGSLGGPDGPPGAGPGGFGGGPLGA